MLLVSVRLLFKGSVNFFGKPADINDGWWHLFHSELLTVWVTLQEW